MPPPLPTNPITPTISPSLTIYTVPLKAYFSTLPNPPDHLVVGALIFTHHRTTTATSITSPPKILLLRRAATDHFPRIWEIPGGSVDLGDSSVIAGCVREVWEETRLRVRALRGVVWPRAEEEVYEFGDERERWWKVCFLVDVEGDGDGKGDGEMKVLLDGEEHEEFGWWGRDELGGLDLHFKEARELIERAFDVMERGG